MADSLASQENGSVLPIADSPAAPVSQSLMVISCSVVPKAPCVGDRVTVRVTFSGETAEGAATEWNTAGGITTDGNTTGVAVTGETNAKQYNTEGGQRVGKATGEEVAEGEEPTVGEAIVGASVERYTGEDSRLVGGTAWGDAPQAATEGGHAISGAISGREERAGAAMSGDGLQADGGGGLEADGEYAYSRQDDYMITGSHISTNSDGSHVLTVNFVPWQVGDITLPPIGGVAIPPVTVVSVFPDGAEGEELRPPLGPLLSPITVHTLYAVVAAAIALAVLLCIAASKWQSIRAYVLLRAMEANERRNERALRKRLDNLIKSKGDDAAFCTELQQTIRAYLETRFGEHFSSLTTGEVATQVWGKTSAISSNETEDAYNALFDVMRRTDYVRFAGGENACLVLREREGLIQKTLSASAVLGGKQNA